MDAKPFKGQDYYLLKPQYNETNLFVDPTFKASSKSIYFSYNLYKNLQNYRIQWRRPKQIFKDPKFVINDFSRLDINQGSVGNCWFIAAMNGITLYPPLFAKVVPPDQSFNSNYAGIFHFRFWQYGNWYDVVIDDLLPYCIYTNQLVFCCNKSQPDELWPALLEKAYAKLYGSYESLCGGFTEFALVDLTGGIADRIDINKVLPNEYDQFWSILYKIYHKNSLMGCYPPIQYFAYQQGEIVQNNGIVAGHAFIITKFAILNYNGRDHRLIRIRNPWGNDVEWNGAWSDRSIEWNYVSDKEKQEIGFNKSNDGEFWMSFEDFMKNWSSVGVCYLSCDSFMGEVIKVSDIENLSWKNLVNNSWKCETINCEFNISSVREGGIGPIHLIKLEKSSNLDSNDQLITLIISATTKHETPNELNPKKLFNSHFALIHIELIKLDKSVQLDSNKLLNLGYFDYQQIKFVKGINERVSCERFVVTPGNYLLRSYVYYSELTSPKAEYLLRIFTDESIETSTISAEGKQQMDKYFNYYEAAEIISNQRNFFTEILNQKLSSYNNFNKPKLLNSFK